MTIDFTVSAVIPASPKAIYDSWLDTDGHTKMTGSPAHATPNVFTQVTLTHTNVPDDQTGHEPGWVTHYFEPMKEHFGKMPGQ